MKKCNCSIEINNIKSLKKHIKTIGNSYFDQHAEDGLEKYIRFEMHKIYLYNKYKGKGSHIKLDEYDGREHLVKECRSYHEEILKEEDKENFESGCKSHYQYYEEQRYIKENQSTNFSPPTGISLVSIVYFISRMFLLDWIKDAKLNRNKVYVPIAFILSALLFSIATTLILHTAGISTLPFLKNVNLPTGGNIITFLPIHFSIAIVCALVATAFLGLGVHKLNNAKTVESTIDLVFKKVENNILDDSCIDCNYIRVHRRLVPILASASAALTIVAFILEVQAHLQSSNSDLLGMGYLNKTSFPLHLGTFLCIATAIGLSVLSSYKYMNKEDKKAVQNDDVKCKDNNGKVDKPKGKGNENEQDPNFLGQSVAKSLILCELPEKCIKEF